MYTRAYTQQNALLADVAATRELCLQLDKTKESLSRQLASQGISYEQVQGQLDDLRLERDLIKQQVFVRLRETHQSKTGLISIVGCRTYNCRESADTAVQ